MSRLRWLLPPVLFVLVWAVLDLFGVAGYRYGFVLSAATLSVAAAAPSAVLARGDRFSPLWYAVAVAFAVVAAGLLVERASPSAGVLAAELDDLQPPLYRVIDEQRTGSASCRPSCAAVVRTYVGPPLGRRAIILGWAAAFDAANFDVDIPGAVQRRSGFRAGRAGIDARLAVAATPDSDGRRRVTVRLSAG